MATSSAPLAESAWTLTAQPAGSMATHSPTAGPTTTLSPDRVGDYGLRYDAVAESGDDASCTTTVRAIVGPPVAICPEGEHRTDVGEPIILYGDAFDDIAVVSVAWRQVSGPGMARTSVVGGNGAIVAVLIDVGGTYEFELTAIDADGSSHSCRVSVITSQPPEVVCPAEPISAPTRRPVSISAMATDDGAIARTSWEMIARPDGSTASPSPPEGLTTSIVPDRRGEYRLRFTAVDGEGQSASCEVTVIGLPTPPELTCPAIVETRPLTDTSIVASAVDDGTIASWGWRVVTSPPGSRPEPPRPPNAPATIFHPDLAGDYVLRLTVADDDGLTDECDTTVRAISVDGLRIEVFWDTDATDMDTHLLRPGAPAWFDGEADCYFGNCTAGGGAPRLSWFAPGPDDDPRLDIDDTNGFGPENINIERPAPGRYRVGVHAWAGFARVTVRVYCGGSTTEPRQTFGPVAIDDRRMWRVADVDVTAAGCAIADLSIGGRPNIISDEESRSMP
jgi:hypothetical protein